jgi:DUF971 family protein
MGSSAAKLKAKGKMNANAWPTGISVNKTRDALTIRFDDGTDYTLEAELLRAHSPSAEVQGHSPDQKVTVWGKRHVTINALVPVGNYAVRIAFDDGHDTGIFTWAYLAELGRTHAQVWVAYEAELAAKGLKR